MARSRLGGAVAVLCRDQEGLYLGSSAVVFHHTRDPLLLETYACREALALADDLAVRNICVACDCQEVVNDINRGIGGPNASIVYEILSLCKSFISFSFIHERRNFNFEARNFVKFACNLGVGRHI